jgi:hypothetical protein
LASRLDRDLRTGRLDVDAHDRMLRRYLAAAHAQANTGPYAPSLPGHLAIYRAPRANAEGAMA